jgi:hypothetical protein
MLTIRVGAENVTTYFKVAQVGRLGKHGFENVTQVLCALCGQDGRTLATGQAFCSPKDEPKLEVGAELAFGRALKRLTSDKELRAKFWDAFWHAINHQMLQELEDEAAFETAMLAQQAQDNQHRTLQPIELNLEDLLGAGVGSYR